LFHRGSSLGKKSVQVIDADAGNRHVAGN
jgi:hypothetical protein